MAGQLIPTQVLLEPFAKNADSGKVTAPFPVASQVGITPGAASFNDGYPAVCFLAPVNGGVLPFGRDFNGITRLLSAWLCVVTAGQLAPWNSDLSTAMGGYAIGARVSKSDGSGQTWTSVVDGNTTNPDSGGAGWSSSVPLFSTVALSGPHDVVLPGASDYLIAVDTSGGAVSFDGFVPQRDGQRVGLYPTSAANILTFNSLTGSTGPHQLQIPAGGVAAVQWQTNIFQYSNGAGKWLLV